MIAGETVNFIMKYPPGHELAGQSIERDTGCSRCERKFTQQRVDGGHLRSYYEHSPDQIKAFLKICEVVEKEVWLPAHCPRCTRSQLNPEANYAPLV